MSQPEYDVIFTMFIVYSTQLFIILLLLTEVIISDLSAMVGHVIRIPRRDRYKKNYGIMNP